LIADSNFTVKSMKTNKLSIKAAITAIAGVSILIGIIYVTYLSNKNFEKTVVSQRQQELLTIATTISTNLDDLLIEHSEALSVVSKNPLFQKNVYEKKRCDEPEIEFCSIKNLYESHKKDVDALNLLDANGIMLHREPYIKDRPGMDHSDKPGVAYVLREHKPHVSEVFYNNLGNLAISISDPIFYKDEFAGIARWMIATDTISRHFVEPIKIGRKGFIWIFDNKNIIISHPRKDFIGMTVLDAIKKVHDERGEVFDESRTKEHIIEEHDYLNKVKSEEEGCGIFINCVTDERDIIAYKRVATGNLIFNLIVTLPYSEITGPINKHAREIFGLAGFVIILLGVGGAALFRSQKEKARLETKAKYLKQISDGAEALATEKEHLEVTLRSIGDGVIATDSDGRIILLNRIAEELTGWAYQNAVGKPLLDVFHIINEITRELCENPVEQVNKTGEIFKLANHTILIAKDGTERILADSAAPILDNRGNIIGVVLVFRDITEKRKIEAHLQQSLKMEAIATLAGGIAHEFNNALAGVSGNIELLQMNLTDNEYIDNYTERIRDSVHRMAGLTNQLLAYASGGKYQSKTLTLKDLVKDTLPILQHNIAPSIRVETDLPDDISNVKVDSTQMQMVLSAVLTNASEAMEDKGRIRIIIRNEKIDKVSAKIDPDLKPGLYVCLTIEDEGKGMEKENIHKVFDPFFTTKFQGRGLGMAAAYGVIRNHGGSISLYSELGKGTVVRIYLPAVEIRAEKTKETKT
jgi:PAS domain S-box-containing protein